MVGDSTAFQLGLVAVTVAGLWIGARLLVDSVVRLARRVGLSELTIGLTIVAAGTSTPELVVTIDAALKGFGDVAVGNALGSNVYNLAFVLGVVSLLRVVPIERSLVHRDGLVLIASALLGGAALLDATITRLEGLAFLGLYALYTASLLRTGDDSDEGSNGTGSSPSLRSDPAAVPTAATERVAFRGRDVAFATVGLAVVLVSGDVLVGAATALARDAGISEWVIGGTVVAAGTSTPEFAVSLVAMRGGPVDRPEALADRGRAVRSLRGGAVGARPARRPRMTVAPASACGTDAGTPGTMAAVVVAGSGLTGRPGRRRSCCPGP